MLWHTCVLLQKGESVLAPLLKAAPHPLLAWDCTLLCVNGLHIKDSTISLKLFSLSTDFGPIQGRRKGMRHSPDASQAHAQHVSELLELHAPVAQAVLHSISILVLAAILKSLPYLPDQFPCT